MKWTAYSLPRRTPRYKEEADPKSGKSREEHTPGWPHLDLRGVCICSCRHCMGVAGCICRTCAGIGHVGCRNATLNTDGTPKDNARATGKTNPRHAARRHSSTV